MYDVTYNPIAEWFYDGINNFQFNDFFSGVGASYNRSWVESEFEWLPDGGSGEDVAANDATSGIENNKLASIA